MTRDEILRRLRAERATFDGLVAHVPRNRLEVPPPGQAHSPKEIVAHVTAYEELIVERLRAARTQQTTEFDRDREGWERFNERTWQEVKPLDAEQVLERASAVFDDLVYEIGLLGDDELNQVVGVTVYIDQAWLNGRTLADLIGIDGFEHYPMHQAALEAAAAG